MVCFTWSSFPQEPISGNRELTKLLIPQLFPVKKGESPSSHQTSSPRIQAFASLLIPQTYPSSATGAGPWVMWLSSAGDPQGLLGGNKCGVVLSTFSS